jgi:hypothetical protein
MVRVSEDKDWKLGIVELGVWSWVIKNLGYKGMGELEENKVEREE